ncbi:hypothetical protein [Streptomyces sp. STR69]|uniref:hypothetical protein n=1 Tax=Streptomyces sp. STR69 TaxID=1796942 RepID=UPI0021CA06F9|nr:hypothetical protein [Streptomyces sp. STR69]
MTPDPKRWAVLGKAISDDRERQGLTQKQLVALVLARGGKVTERTIINLEGGEPPRTRAKPLKLEIVVAALGWEAGWTDRILAGEDPAFVLRRDTPQGRGVEGASPRTDLSELLMAAYEFSRTAAQLGAPAELRDEFDVRAQELYRSVPAGVRGGSGLGLAAYRPHAAGAGVPADDAARIREALGGES